MQCSFLQDILTVYEPKNKIVFQILERQCSINLTNNNSFKFLAQVI